MTDLTIIILGRAIIEAGVEALDDGQNIGWENETPDDSYHDYE